MAPAQNLESTDFMKFARLSALIKKLYLKNNKSSDFLHTVLNSIKNSVINTN